MGLLSWLKPTKTRNDVVRIKLCDLGETVTLDEGGYFYRWRLAEEPLLGQYVYVPGWETPERTGMVVGIATEEDIAPFEEREVLRLVTAKELAEDAARRERDEAIWMDLMALQAGLPGTSHPVPDDFRLVPPVVAEVDLDSARRYAGLWWRAYKNARTTQEELRFKEIATSWYKRRDELEEQERILRLRANVAALVNGRHYTEWVEQVKELKRAGRYEDALVVLRDCQQATLRADGNNPSPWYFEQEAIIQAKLRNPEAELRAIDAYLAAAADPSEKLVQRRAKVLAKMPAQKNS